MTRSSRKSGEGRFSLCGAPCSFTLVLCSLLTLSTSGLLAQSSEHERIEPPNTATPSRAQVDRAIALAAGYLERACGPDGKFVYEVDTFSGRKSNLYDIIRHAGAMYALAMFNQQHPDRQAADTLVRAARFMLRNYVGPGVRPGQLAVWSKPVSSNRQPTNQYAELGGAGLGLVALAATRQIDPKSVSLDQLQALGRFLLFLQREDGSFVHKYDAKSGSAPNWHSLYYPGEAALGLVALYEADGSSQWLDAATKTLVYLAKSRVGLSTVPSDHWALIATVKLLHYCDAGACPSARDELIQHALQVCNSILHEQFRGSAAVGLDGAFDPDGRTTPAATRLEGLLSALEFLPKGDLRERIVTAIEHGIGFLLRTQIVSGPNSGGMPGAILLRAGNASEIRIDYVQHSLCALLRYRLLSLQR